ncbi:MAG: GGDEF domain-containing protein [Euzebya sp.]
MVLPFEWFANDHPVLHASLPARVGLLAALWVVVDQFKELNDTQGHEAGDIALRLVSTALRATVRNGDVVARWGGDEFMVLLMRTDVAGAMDHAERLRMALQRATPVTASFGVARAEVQDDLTDWVRRADQALYEAKALGRNRVCGRALDPSIITG